ncbi:hypothetical protein F3Y22_tig00111387pilonHSYRG00051 [Hibiscus syriacus]|uniref:Uncharacterized protein n=1 Tax=Hibiscus syriacus TaxID=106335 RepID=A0A6A2YME8_HIBSY|nr:hypothetical protein F3Y22_tig00111387pilonHSYRG00051 [Hibiscus syriacus]
MDSGRRSCTKVGVLKHGTGKWRNIHLDPEFSSVLRLRSNVDINVWLNNLKELQISNSNITNSELSYLRGLNKLNILNLEGCNVTAACLDSISDIVTCISWGKPVGGCNVVELTTTLLRIVGMFTVFTKQSKAPALLYFLFGVFKLACTQLEFYNTLCEVNSPLKNHIPTVLASGIMHLENGSYKIDSWDDKEVLDVLEKCNLILGCT